MISLQLFGQFRPTFKLIVKSYSFSQKDRILLLNSTNKSLYGPVVKTKPSKASQRSIKHKKVTSAESTDDALKKTETNCGSEMYWLIGNKWKGILAEGDPKVVEDSKIIISSQQRKPLPTNCKENASDAKPDNSAKLVENEEINSNLKTPFIRQKPILLSNEQLNNVLTHPLQCDVLSTPPNNIRALALRRVPSVGKILQYTMSESARTALLNWKLAKIHELGEQGFIDLQQCEQIKINDAVHFNNSFHFPANLFSGHTFHWSLQHYFLTKEIPIGTLRVLST